MKSTLLRISFSVIFISVFMTLTGQNDLKYKLYNDAVKCYYSKDFNGANKIISTAIQLDSLRVNSHLLKAAILTELKDYSGSIRSYKKALSLKGDSLVYTYFDLAEVLFACAQYNEAKTNYNTFLGKQKEKETDETVWAAKQLLSCDFAIEAMKNPVEFKPENLGKNVNSTFDEYLPSLTADGSLLVITRKVLKNDPYGIYGKVYQEDFYECSKAGDSWTLAKPLRGAINTDSNEGAQTISADGKYMFFTACQRDDGMGECDIYFAVKSGAGWSPAQNLKNPVNTEFWESQPSISSDNTTLYFSSTRSGGYGGLDLWKATISAGGIISEPENLGPQINTEYNESGPFIHPDNRTLYFSSNGLPGMGGTDLFYSRLGDDNTWSTPVNLGYPINSQGNENSLVLNSKGDLAYISSEREGGLGGIDLYTFKLYEKARPAEVTYLKGIVYDAVTKKPLSAKFEFIHLETGEKIISSVSSRDKGDFLVCIPTDKNYALNVSCDGYMFFSENFSFIVDANTPKPYVKDIPLQPIKEGEKIILKNVFFETGAFALKPESKAELNILVGFMNQHPGMQIEVSGHTDDVGTEESNQILSQNRAKSVYDYLISQGVVKTNITYIGYGEKQPVSDNTSEEGKAQNRRTEFKIIKL